MANRGTAQTFGPSPCRFSPSDACLCVWLDSALLMGPVERQLTLNEVALAGGMAGFAIAFVEGPFDNLKCKLQAQTPGGAGNYSGVFDAGRRIAGQHGVAGLYQGIAATLLRNVPANAAYFWGYEGCRRAMTPTGETPTMLTNFLAGGGAGVFYWLSVYPLELIKTRMQSEPVILANRKYTGVLDCVSKTFRNEGAGAFFKGFSAAMLRSFPANAFCFLGYELALTNFRPHFESSK